MREGTAMDGRMRRISDRCRNWTAVGVCTLAALLLASGAPPPAWGADEGAESLIEVAPGVHLAPASDLAQGGNGPVPTDLALPSLHLEPAPAPRVVGGSTTTIDRWPWQVSIGYLPLHPTNAFRNHNCGGTLVAPRVVVSAAHCFNFGTPNYQPPEEFQVITGRTKLSTNAGQEHEIADYYWFVDEHGRALFDRARLEWDVVFAVLASSSSQETIKIAGRGEEVVWTPGRRAFVTGWGSTKVGTDAQLDEAQSDVLRQAKIRMISDSVCDSAYGAVLVPEVMVCAGDMAGGADVCAGDSGGPLVVPIAGGGYRLVGDVSFGDGCGLPRTPGVYGRLASDPIRGALQTAIQEVAGVDVVGSEAGPSNGLGFGQGRSRVRNGAARLAVRVPGRGQVLVHRSARMRRAVVYPREAGGARVPLRPRGKAKRRLNRVGNARIRIRVSYTPMGGQARTRSTRVRLVKRL